MNGPHGGAGPQASRRRISARQAQSFFRQAEAELAAAAALLATGGHFFRVAGSAQLSAELAIKAAHLHVRSEVAPATHSMRPPAAGVFERLGYQDTDVMDAIDRLEPLQTATRYPALDPDAPIPADLFRAEDARAALTDATVVVEWARALLLQQPGRPRRT